MSDAWSRRSFAGGAGATLGSAACGPRAPASSRPAVWPGAAPFHTFPIKPALRERRLVDASGAPFWMHGDAAWSLIAQLSREDAALYLDDRRARGFNTILVSLIEHHYADNAPANFYGDAPFLSAGDFATPNERYFAHADWVLNAAAERGFLVLATPCYIGWVQAGDGWYAEMAVNGPEKMRRYGGYLIERFGAHENIVWVHGGDDNPPNRAIVRAVAQGMVAAQPGSLHTAHCARGAGAMDYWANEPWLGLDNVYAGYGADVVLQALRHAHQRDSGLPFFFLEGIYENDRRYDASRALCTPLELRYQAYFALLGGACGHIFGNNPVWRFDGPGALTAPYDWRTGLNSPGAHYMTHLWNLLSMIPGRWLAPLSEELAPAPGASMPAAGGAAGELLICYLPEGRATLDASLLQAPSLRLRWYDPTSGDLHDAPSVAATAATALRAPGGNAGGDNDWVAVITGSA